MNCHRCGYSEQPITDTWYSRRNNLYCIECQKDLDIGWFNPATMYSMNTIRARA